MPARLVALALPLAFLFGGAHGFGYIQTVEVTETVEGVSSLATHTFSRTCAADCPQCTATAITYRRGQDLSASEECVCIEGDLRPRHYDYENDYENDYSAPAESWTLTAYDDCAFITTIGRRSRCTPAKERRRGRDQCGTQSTIDGGSGDDELAVKHAANNEIIGGDGNDEIYALELDYHKGFLDGGAGDDVIEIGRSGFKVTGDAGADTISMTVLDQIGDVQRPVAVTISERFWVGKQ
ncbi:hypothetical protein JL721_5155 [Aureococcus anophagefferens]|nr:hypothetical protein JL721_5155 [Aureococcus anophagefferens]